MHPDAECPDCGARPVYRRNRATGEEFIGCSAYPKCRFTCRPHDGRDPNWKANGVEPCEDWADLGPNPFCDY